MLNDRELKIITFLENKNEYVSGEELAAFLGISSKTLRNDIKMINLDLTDKCAQIISVKGKGYLLSITDFKVYDKYLHKVYEESLNIKTCIPTTHEGRVNYIIQKLLLKELNKEDRIIQSDLSEELYIGLTTLKSDLIDVRKELEQFNIKVIKDGIKGISLDGEEEDIRASIRHYMFCAESNFIDLEAISHIFKKENVMQIDQILKEALRRNRLTITDISYYNLLVHILISIERVERNNTVHIEQFNESLLSMVEYETAKEIMFSIEETLNIKLTDDEIYYIALHLLTRKTLLGTSDDKESVQDEYYLMVEETLDYLEKNINLNFKRDEILKNSLSVHLKSAINRIRFDMHINNSLLLDIKRNYAFSFKISSLAAKYLEERYDVKINEDEIGYICLHLEAALQRMKNVKTAGKVRALIVCASGLGTAMMISAKVKSEFVDVIEIVKVISLNELKEVDTGSFDIILSTIEINLREYEIENKTFVYIPVILKKKDIDSIGTIIREKQGNAFIDFLEYTEEDLFFAETDFSSKEEIMEFMLSKMQQKHYLSKEDTAYFYKRENISSTEIGNMVAIPHAIDIDPNISKIAILINKKGVVWEQEKVRLVILLSIKKELYANFESIFEELYNVLSEEEKVFSLLNVKNYREFIKVLR